MLRSIAGGSLRTQRVGRKCLRGNKAALALWADVPADILGTVPHLLPCLADRASVRSVCRQWRAPRARVALPTPLPVLVLPRSSRFSCLASDGTPAARRSLMTIEATADDVRIIGSCDDWLMADKKNGEQCFLVNAFSREVVHLSPWQSACPSDPVPCSKL